MATHVNTNPNPSLTKDIIMPHIFTWLPKEIIYDIILRLPFETLLILRSVSKSCMSLISSPDLIDVHLFEPNNDGVFSLLPKVIIYNILLRLPVETLLRLKSFSKSWLSLISSSGFIKTHLLKSTNDPQFTLYHLLISSDAFMPNGERYYDSLNLKSLSLYSLLNEPDTKAFESDFSNDGITEVVGSCNGLVCLASRSDVLLWNPSTGEFRELPNLISQRYKVCAFGFCYDEVNDDFKVFAIFVRRGRDHGHSEYEVSVYSLKTDSWRMIVDFPYAGLLYNLYSRGVFANEAIHWVVRPSNESKIIVSLDIKTETFGEVLPPKYAKNAGRWTLGTFGKSLSFCIFGSAHADFWVMKKCDVEGSWTKLFTIPYMDRPAWLTHLTQYPNIDMHVNLERLSPLSYLKPVNISMNGDIIMMLNSRIQLYNPKDNTFKELFNRGRKEHDYDTGYQCYVEPYVESLVSPHL